MSDTSPATQIEKATRGALALSSDQSVWTDAQAAALRQIGLEDATQDDLAVFLHVAQRSGLDPFARQIYMIGRKSKQWNPQTRQETWSVKYTIQTGIDGFRLIADRTGKYEGQTEPEWCGPDGVWRTVWLQSKPPAAARVGVWKTGYRSPVYGVAIFTEYAQTKADGSLTQMWGSKPSVMISKCAEALAFRKAFPQDLSGLYTAEEMAQADQTDQRQVQQAERVVVGATPSVVIDQDWYIDLENYATMGNLDELARMGAEAQASGSIDALAKFRKFWPEAKAIHDQLAEQQNVVDADPAEAAQG